MRRLMIGVGFVFGLVGGLLRRSRPGQRPMVLTAGGAAFLNEILGLDPRARLVTAGCWFMRYRCSMSSWSQF